MNPRKRKISVRKIIQTLVTLILTGACVMAITSAAQMQEQKKIKQVHIQIKNERACGFIQQEDIQVMLFDDRHIQPADLPLAALNTLQMKNIATANPWISDAQVYIDNQLHLHINITQRVPIFRVFEVTGNSYYLDKGLNAIPLSDKYTHYAPVINNVPCLQADSLSRDMKAQMMQVVRAIGHDTFWREQVQEINVLPNRSFELVPVVGSHRIQIGDSARLTEKLHNVLVFYKQVLNKIGWDKYRLLDARYQGQVVASPALPWKPPKDRAMSNMNWVKSIMDAVPQDAAAYAMPMQAAPEKEPKSKDINNHKPQ
jgi:cell division protein FtsQ